MQAESAHRSDEQCEQFYARCGPREADPVDELGDALSRASASVGD